MIVEGCNSGWHRSEVTGRTLKDALNEVTTVMAAGDKVKSFNAQYFGLCHCKKKPEQVGALESSLRWMDERWATMDIPPVIWSDTVYFFIGWNFLKL